MNAHALQNERQDQAFAESGDLTALLQKEFKPKTEQAKSAVEQAVQTLAQQALANTVTISSDAYQAIQEIIAEIDRKMSEQINLIMHHNDFQTLEGAWRGPCAGWSTA